MKDTITFLKEIYEKQCHDGDYVMLSVKGPEIKWKDVAIKYGKTFDQKLKEFFEEYPSSRYDLYFSPMAYSQPKRRIEFATDTKLMVQDIDEHDNVDGLDPKPTYLWESSPNKYQGIWELDRYIEEPIYTPLNKSLAEHIGCDDCFDYTHVYRIPGTLNHKYKNSPPVKMPQNSNKIYKPKAIGNQIGHNKKSQKAKVNITSDGNIAERKIYAKYSIPQNIRELLAMDDISGVDRSDTIWFIENKLHELGMNPNEIITLVRNSAFNKYKGRNDELTRLRAELEKIISGDIDDTISQSMGGGLTVSSYQDVMGNHNVFQGWLVKGFWGRRSHGIVAGMPKCFKSTLVHDLAIAVASGTKFLGKYEVEDPGPVIMVQNENADYVMKDRTEKMILHKGLEGEVETGDGDQLKITFPVDLPISFINQQGFMITNSSHRKQLEDLIKSVRPVLVILDPLYLMFDGELNSAKELNPVLQWLLFLKNEYNVSIIMIHHYNKGSSGMSNKGGQRMMGSVMLYSWVESAWYLSKEDEPEGQPNNIADEAKSSDKPAVVTMNREFRFAGYHPEIDIHLHLEPIGEPGYDIDITLSGVGSVASKSSTKEDIVNMLSSYNAPLTRRRIADQLGLDKQKVRDLLEDLIKDKKVMVQDGGFIIYKTDDN